MVVLNNVVIFTKFFFEFVLSTGIAFVIFVVLIAVLLDMIAEYCEMKKCEREKENKKENKE